MALTRRTARFNELAEAFEAGLAEHDLVLESDVVDQILRHRVDRVAESMRVTPRTALGYAPEDLPQILTETVLRALEQRRAEAGERRPRLRVVPPAS